MNIIMLGAPGAGKGTISSIISDTYNLPHISTGDIFRENIKNGTELGMKVKSIIDSGALCPDDLTIELMLDRLSQDDCKVGYILDGFPRTISQAVSFSEALRSSNQKVDLVILVEADDEKIVNRLEGRRVCEKCGESYHIVSLKPKVDGICDKCGGNLIQRKDDSREVAMNRLKTYHEQTAPLIDYYSKLGIVKNISGFIDSREEMIIQLDTIMKI